MLGLVDNKKVVIVGIPGVGKTSLVTKLVELITQQSKTVSVHSFGTVMLEEAMKNGIKDRDELRTLPIEKQKNLQKIAAEDIAKMEDDVILIDTHAFISTKSGFYPGLPNYVIQIIQPSNFIAITASPDEIHNRRMKDTTRNRDPVSIEDIKKELAVQDAMLSSCSVLSGSPMKVIFNHEGKVDEAAKYCIRCYRNMIEFNFILNFLDLVFLQGDLFGIRGEGPLGSADPLVKGMLPSAFAVIGFSIMLNLFNAGVRKKLVDSVKLKRIMKETKTWQKARMAAFKAKDEAKIAELSKKSTYMNKMSMEMMHYEHEVP